MGKKPAPKKPTGTPCNRMSKNGRCGKAFGNTICNGVWCSKWNWCGTSALHKSTMQKAFSLGNFKACAKKAPVKKPVGKKPPVKKPVGKKVAGTPCNRMSKNGRCGKAFGNTICNGVWCSKWNWCGLSALHKSTMQKPFSMGNFAHCVKPGKPKPKVPVKGKAGVPCTRMGKNGRCGKAFKNTICYKSYCSK